MQLQVKLAQQLVMTPQLVQAIRLLQLSRLELVEEVRKELDGNPVLADDRIEPKETTEAGRREGEEARAAARTDEAGAAQPQAGEASGQDEQRSQDLDWDKYLENQQLRQPVGSARGGFDELPPIEQNLTRPPSLREHLMWQLQMGDVMEDELRFAELVIGNLDDKGYLDLKLEKRELAPPQAEPSEAAAAEQSEQPSSPPAEGSQPPPSAPEKTELTIEDLAEEAGLHPDDAHEVLELIQRLDPVGVACRSLQECLLVQAEVLGMSDIEMSIIRHHLRDVERRNLGAIVKALDIDMDEVVEAVREIRKLESIPARNFSDVDDRTIAITPDVYVVKDGERFLVTDNDRGMQRLYVNESLVKRMLRDPKAKEFINDKLRSAQWLIRAIEQRRRTIIKVTDCIVEKQREFLEKGVAFLKPMILRDVAESVGMHESTISRVTSNKYVQTPQGLFELKYFFNSSISRIGNDDIASESVKQAIRKIIDGENKEKPLSDQAIVKTLQHEHGVRIARRTVAKYREMLGILSSAKRKKLF